jgi:hypothetical protein
MGEVTNLEELLQGVANFGFPIIVSAYLLIRMEGKMENLQRAIIDLSNAIERVSNQK